MTVTPVPDHDGLLSATGADVVMPTTSTTSTPARASTTSISSAPDHLGDAHVAEMPSPGKRPSLATTRSGEPRAAARTIAKVADAARYGPGALATPANAITILRLVLSPALLVMIVREPDSWAAAGFWTVLAFSDGIDGHLARRHGTTRSGAFLDPLADKVLVLGALFALVAAGRFWLLPVGLIALREVAISVYRTRLGREGLAVPARRLAKLKTIVQEFAVAFALFPFTSDRPMLAVTTLWVAVALTWVTGAQYLADGRSAATRLGHRPATA